MDEDEPRAVIVLRVGDLVHNTQQAVRWMARTGWDVGQRLPGAGLVERELRRVERGAQRFGRAALDELARRVAAVNASMAERGAATRDGRRDPLRAGMAELLNRSVDSSVESSRRYLFDEILRRLVPDEARIIAALSDGTVYPVIDVASRTALGGTGQVVQRYASTVGKSAGITLVDNVPTYLARLLELGLVEIGAEENSLDMEYDVLQTDPLVQRGEQRAKADGRMAPRLLRRSVRISELGTEFWKACDPTGG